jgi:hypothetical protein
MNWGGKTRESVVASAAASPRAVATVAAPAASERNVRQSHGMKDFLWLISDAQHGRILDLGPVWQSTVNFFIERGFRVSTEDVLRSWKEFLGEEEQRLRSAPVGSEAAPLSPDVLAERFLETALQYSPENFHGVLAWDLCDYFDKALMTRLVSRLYDLLRPGGAVLALFHSRHPERFHRYRIMDRDSVELIAAPPPTPHERIFQNREILNLFGQFRSSKTFVGRDQIREGLFLK